MRETKNLVHLVGFAYKDSEQKSMAAPVRIFLETGGETLPSGKKNKTQRHILVDWHGKRGLAIRKGDQIECRGAIDYSMWEKDGQKHYKTEIRVDELHHEGETQTGHQSDEAISQGRAKTIQRGLEQGKPIKPVPIEDSGFPF
jgi:hypothetical protein